MRSLKLILFLAAILTLGLAGCSRDSSPLSPAAGDDAPGPLFGWQLPAEATLTERHAEASTSSSPATRP